MKPLRPSPPYGFLCILSLAGPRTGVYPSLYRCSGSYGIKVSTPFPLRRGSPKEFSYPLPLHLPLPHFHHHAHSVLPHFFKTQLHALKLLPSPPISHLHHWIEASCFALDETFLPLWHPFALRPFVTHVRSSFVCPEDIYCTGKYFHLSSPNAPSTLYLHPLKILSNNTCT
jgi:hypothetical protein